MAKSKAGAEAKIRETKAERGDLHPQYKAPNRICYIPSMPRPIAAAGKKAVAKVGAKSTRPRERSRGISKSIAEDIKIEPELSQLKFDKVTSSVLGNHVLFQAYLDWPACLGAWARSISIRPVRYSMS